MSDDREYPDPYNHDPYSHDPYNDDPYAPQSEDRRPPLPLYGQGESSGQPPYGQAP